MSSDRYEALRERLLTQKQEILDMYNQDLKAGQESADDGTDDLVDRANAAYNRELMFSLSDAERTMLLQIEDALKRMGLGAYGRCTNCGRICVPLLASVAVATASCKGVVES